MNKGNRIDITNSSFIINSKGASNRKEANEDVENIPLQITVNLIGSWSKVLRPTSVQIYYPVHCCMLWRRKHLEFHSLVAFL
jgi:hypothetical protein